MKRDRIQYNLFWKPTWVEFSDSQPAEHMTSNQYIPRSIPTQTA